MIQWLSCLGLSGPSTCELTSVALSIEALRTATMPASAELAGFLHLQFRSVWALELLLHLKRNSERAWSRAELVEAFRASDAVIGTSLDNLLAGGLVVVEDDQHARYCPANDDLERLIGETAMLYAKSPDAVRRLIVSSPASDVSAFADAFRLRRD